jgi:hypothetical protein
MLQHLRGEWKEKLHQGGLAKRIHERLLREAKMLETTGVSRNDAGRVNSFLWWLQSQAGREDAVFISLEDLLSI